MNFQIYISVWIYKIYILLLHRDEKDSDDLKYGLIGTILIVFVICVSVAVAYRYCKPGTCIILRKPQETQELHELQEQTQGTND